MVSDNDILSKHADQNAVGSAKRPNHGTFDFNRKAKGRNLSAPNHSYQRAIVRRLILNFAWAARIDFF